MKKGRVDMLFLHDCWVNLVSEDNLYCVPDFHEWRKEENVELVDRTPVIKVDKNTFNYIAFGSNELVEFANEVEGETFFRKNHERIRTDYCFIASDSERVLFVRLDQDKKVIFKSKLIPRQYQLVIEMMLNTEEIHKVQKFNEISEYGFYAGLTRKERESYKVLESFLKNVSENDLAMVKYLLSEISFSTYKEVKDGDLGDCLTALKTLHPNVIVQESANIEKVLGKLTTVK
jgi:hypothetical protein